MTHPPETLNTRLRPAWVCAFEDGAAAAHEHLSGRLTLDQAAIRAERREAHWDGVHAGYGLGFNGAYGEGYDAGWQSVAGKASA